MIPRLKAGGHEVVRLVRSEPAGRNLGWHPERGEIHLPIRGGFDAVVSGLVINFLPEPAAGVRAMAARARPGATVAGYVWDYAAGMRPLRVFWDAVTDLDQTARAHDEGPKFPVCSRPALEAVFLEAGLRAVAVRPLEITAEFESFDDYWTPFLSGQGPAPGYVASLSPERQARLREVVRKRLDVRSDGTIRLPARAWAASGLVSRRAAAATGL